MLPVRISSLAEFGELKQVGQRLLDAEHAKESTLSVTMVDAAVREAPSGPVYDFEYELESTRGRKRILSTVTVVGSKLYIANGALSCSKQSCDAVTDDAALLRTATRSLQVQR